MYISRNPISWQKVTDAQTTDYQLGDFKNGTNSDDDYDYDINGNLTKEQNKGISSISYNILNLPQTITVANKGTISYLYACPPASGMRRAISWAKR